jgi:multicomponent Na+:H+ antiporter subunit D
VFLGLGPREARDGEQHQAGPAREAEEGEEDAPRDRTPPLMVLVPATLLVAVIVIGLIPGLIPGIEKAASHFGDHLAYTRWVLRSEAARFAHASTSHVETFDYLYAAGATLGAVALAALGLFGRPLLERVPRAVLRPLTVAFGRVRDLHSGHVGDYIAWWTAGAALMGGASLILMT